MNDLYWLHQKPTECFFGTKIRGEDGRLVDYDVKKVPCKKYSEILKTVTQNNMGKDVHITKYHQSWHDSVDNVTRSYDLYACKEVYIGFHIHGNPPDSYQFLSAKYK
jgi:hypothetical protein